MERSLKHSQRLSTPCGIYFLPINAKHVCSNSSCDLSVRGAAQGVSILTLASARSNPRAFQILSFRRVDPKAMPAMPRDGAQARERWLKNSFDLPITDMPSGDLGHGSHPAS